MNHPTTFAQSLEHLSLPNPTVLERLEQADFTVYTGLRKEDVPDITAIANSAAVREFCPKDCSDRFGNETQAQQWLSKERTIFQLRERSTGVLAGYGWTGLETTPDIPDVDTTFAIRLAPNFSGRHLGAPFTRIIVAGSTALYGSRLWLETWGSNTAAVRTYLHAGAELVTTKDSWRPTLVPQETESDQRRRDVRLFMRFPVADVL